MSKIIVAMILVAVTTVAVSAPASATVVKKVVKPTKPS